MYITLSSNVCMEGNKIAQFRTKLSKTVYLNGEWEVGLSEITYTKSWFNVLNSTLITLYDEIGNDYFPKDESTRQTFTLAAGFYDSCQKLIGEINKILGQFTEIRPPKIIYNEINNKVTVISGKIKDKFNVFPHLGDELEDLLGLRDRNINKNIYSTEVVTNTQHIFRDTHSNETIVAYHPMEIAAGYQTLYLYTDIA